MKRLQIPQKIVHLKFNVHEKSFRTRNLFPEKRKEKHVNQTVAI